MPLARFEWTSAIGGIPLIALAVVLGARLEPWSIADPVVWGSLAGFAVLSGISHPIGRRWQRRSRSVREPA